MKLAGVLKLRIFSPASSRSLKARGLQKGSFDDDVMENTGSDGYGITNLGPSESSFHMIWS